MAEAAAFTQTTLDMFAGRKPARVNMTNRKPFRTKAERIEARRIAHRCDDGAWRSAAPASLHREIPVQGK